VSNDNLKYQDFFIKLISEFPQMPRMAIWLDKYGDKPFASWGGISQNERLWGLTAAGQGLGERFSSETTIGNFLYSLTFASKGVFLVISVEESAIGFVFDNVKSVDDLLLILKDSYEAMRLKLNEPKSP
jgi:hypothetical protein